MDQRLQTDHELKKRDVIMNNSGGCLFWPPADRHENLTQILFRVKLYASCLINSKYHAAWNLSCSHPAQFSPAFLSYPLQVAEPYWPHLPRIFSCIFYSSPGKLLPLATAALTATQLCARHSNGHFCHMTSLRHCHSCLCEADWKANRWANFPC